MRPSRLVDVLDGRALQWAACLNVRDLGGLPAARGVTRRGAFVRADNLSQLTPEGLHALRDYGVSTVVDLRSPSEIADLPNPLADRASAGPIQYINLPMIDEATSEALRVVETREESYRTILRTGHDRTVEIVKTLAAADGTIAFHCHGGQDRTGLIAALLLSLAGVPPEPIVADYALTFGHLRAIHGAWVDQAPDPDERERRAQDVRDPERFMRSTIAFLDEDFGGPVDYLRAGGLLGSEIDRLRARLL